VKVELLKACAEDLDVVNAARVSVDQWHDLMEEGDDKLISYLMRKKHGSPFEHAYFQFRVEAPIFVFREWHRHRVGHSYNEMSARYTELQPIFYKPDEIRIQIGRPGHYRYVPLKPEADAGIIAEAKDIMHGSFEQSWSAYQDLLGLGVAKEQARVVLPVGTYSKMIWSCNPRSFMHFLALRNAPDAQKEIRLLAASAEQHLRSYMPITHAAFVENGRVAP
jgi:thymidylate synthase (FAD)